MGIDQTCKDISLRHGKILLDYSDHGQEVLGS